MHLVIDESEVKKAVVQWLETMGYQNIDPSQLQPVMHQEGDFEETTITQVGYKLDLNPPTPASEIGQTTIGTTRKR